MTAGMDMLIHPTPFCVNEIVFVVQLGGPLAALTLKCSGRYSLDGNGQDFVLFLVIPQDAIASDSIA